MLVEDTAPRSPDQALAQSLNTRLLNDFLHDFPLCPAPFAELAARLGVGERTVLRALEQLRREGKIARVGAVFAPKRIGASTLVAMAVAPQQLDSVSEALERFPEVYHLDRREHRYNLWFVVTAGSDGRLQAALGAIAQATGQALLTLPLLDEYRADAAAPAGGDERTSPPVFGSPTRLDEIERRLVMALQEGLPLFIRPFAVLASRVGCDEAEVLERIRNWCAQGIVKRFGVVLRRPDAGGAVEAMLVHDIPDAQFASVAGRLAGEPGVTLCCHRPRVLPEWPYNLFCTLRGPLRDELLARIAEMRARLGLLAYPYAVLFSAAKSGTAGA